MSDKLKEVKSYEKYLLFTTQLNILILHTMLFFISQITGHIQTNHIYKFHFIPQGKNSRSRMKNCIPRLFDILVVFKNLKQF